MDFGGLDQLPKEMKVYKERRFRIAITLRDLYYVIFISVAILFIWYVMFHKRYIIIYIVKEKNKTYALLFSILVALLTFMYLQVLGLSFGVSKSYKRIFLFCYVIWIYIEILTSFGFGVHFRLPHSNYHILFYDTFETNSADGIRFYVYNFLVFFVIYIISYIMEGEKK